MASVFLDDQVQRALEKSFVYVGGDLAQERHVAIVVGAAPLATIHRSTGLVHQAETALDPQSVKRLHGEFKFMKADTPAASQKIKFRFICVFSVSFALIVSGTETRVCKSQFIGQPHVKRQQRGVRVVIPKPVGSIDHRP